LPSLPFATFTGGGALLSGHALLSVGNWVRRFSRDRLRSGREG
jgi:hypothetical protein